MRFQKFMNILVFKPHKKLVVKSYTWVIINNNVEWEAFTYYGCGWFTEKRMEFECVPLSVVVLQMWRPVSWECLGCNEPGYRARKWRIQKFN